MTPKTPFFGTMVRANPTRLGTQPDVVHRARRLGGHANPVITLTECRFAGASRFSDMGRTSRTTLNS
jgi:hypothetical protein